MGREKSDPAFMLEQAAINLSPSKLYTEIMFRMGQSLSKDYYKAESSAIRYCEEHARRLVWC